MLIHLLSSNSCRHVYLKIMVGYDAKLRQSKMHICTCTLPENHSSRRGKGGAWRATQQAAARLTVERTQAASGCQTGPVIAARHGGLP